MKKIRNVKPSKMSGSRFLLFAIEVGWRVLLRFVQNRLRFVQNRVIGRERYRRFVHNPWYRAKRNLWRKALYADWLEYE